MLHYFYYLHFEYEYGKSEEGNPLKNGFAIGYFSTRAKAETQIQFHKNLPGFCDHPLDCFKIEKYGVRFKTKVEDKSLVNIWELSHEYYDGVYDYPTILPPFSTEKEAIEKKEKLKKKKPFCDYPDEFFINEMEVDRYTGWTEGFRELDEEDEACREGFKNTTATTIR